MSLWDYLPSWCSGTGTSGERGGGSGEAANGAAESTGRSWFWDNSVVRFVGRWVLPAGTAALNGYYAAKRGGPKAWLWFNTACNVVSNFFVPQDAWDGTVAKLKGIKHKFGGGQRALAYTFTTCALLMAFGLSWDAFADSEWWLLSGVLLANLVYTGTTRVVGTLGVFETLAKGIGWSLDKCSEALRSIPRTTVTMSRTAAGFADACFAALSSGLASVSRPSGKVRAARIGSALLLLAVLGLVVWPVQAARNVIGAEEFVSHILSDGLVWFGHITGAYQLADFALSWPTWLKVTYGYLGSLPTMFFYWRNIVSIPEALYFFTKFTMQYHWQKIGEALADIPQVCSQHGLSYCGLPALGKTLFLLGKALTHGAFILFPVMGVFSGGSGQSIAHIEIIEERFHTYGLLPLTPELVQVYEWLTFAITSGVNVGGILAALNTSVAGHNYASMLAAVGARAENVENGSDDDTAPLLGGSGSTEQLDVPTTELAFFARYTPGRAALAVRKEELDRKVQHFERQRAVVVK